MMLKWMVLINFGCSGGMGLPAGKVGAIDRMCYLWHNLRMKKIVVIDKRSDKELKRFPQAVQLKFFAL